MTAFLAAFCLAFSMPLAAEPVKEKIRALPVSPTPESKTIVLKIAVPKDGSYVRGNPVWVQFRIDGFSLGNISQFDRRDEVAGTSMGQTVHVIIDNYPYFAVNEPALDPFNEGGYFYDLSYKFEVPFNLKPGRHTIRVFPARSFGESLKGEGTFHATEFFLGQDTPNFGVDLNQPYLTYNEPSDNMELVEGRPVLLDFYISNTELTPDGYKVRLTIDGTLNRMLTSWQPYYIYGLKKGKHTIRLELLDNKDKVLPGSTNKVERTITIR